MLKKENQCCSCGLPCLGSTCPNQNVPVYYCDHCGEELDEVYEVDGEDLCEVCLKKLFVKEVGSI